jgi:hypothetical protein
MYGVLGINLQQYVDFIQSDVQSVQDNCSTNAGSGGVPSEGGLADLTGEIYA